jgi:hypothetical protein
MGMFAPYKATAAGANPWVTALKYFAVSGTKPAPVIGWDDDTAKGIDALTTTANTSIVVKFLADDDSSTETIATISNTVNSGERSIELYPQGCRGKHSFALQFEWSNGAKVKTDYIQVGAPFSLDYLRIPLAQAIAASFVGTIKMPIKYKISVEND